VIISASQKGGSGKSTLLANLAVEAAKDSSPGEVALIDGDPQGTLDRWYGLRPTEDIQGYRMLFEDLLRGIDQLKTQKKIKYIFVDTSAANTQSINQILKIADLVIIPAKASKADVWSASKTANLLKEQNIPFTFVLNMVKPRVRATDGAESALSFLGAVAKTRIGDRSIYADSLGLGLSGPEADTHSVCVNEMFALWKEVKVYLSRHNRVAA